MEGHAKKCDGRYCELANKKRRSNCTQFQRFAWMITAPRKSRVRLDILWSVNKQACSRSHKMTRTCDRRANRLIYFSHHTNNYRQYCRVDNTAQHSRLGLFQDSDFAGGLEDSESPSVGNTYLWKSNICFHKWDVQDSNISLSQFHRI